VIASTADASKNVLNTGTLSYSDIANQASYSAISVSVGGGSGGFGLPGLSVPQGKDASSTTQAAIANGTLVVRNTPDQDLSGLSHDASLDNSQALKNDFDPAKIAEQQQLGQLAGQVGMTAAGDIEQAHGWDAGSGQSIALHTVAGALSAGLGGGNALAGALGAGVSEAATPWLVQQFGVGALPITSMLVGAIAGGGAGAATAAAGTQYNYLNHQQRDQKAADLAGCGADTDCQQKKEAYWDGIDQTQGASMAQSLIAQGGISPALQEQLQDTDPSSSIYASLLSQAIVQSAQVNPSASATMGLYLSLANQYDGEPSLSAYAQGSTQAQLNALTGPILGPVFGVSGNAALYSGKTPEQVAAAYEVGGIVFGAITTVTELNPRATTVVKPVTEPVIEPTASEPPLSNSDVADIAGDGVKPTSTPIGPQSETNAQTTSDVLSKYGNSAAKLVHVFDEPSHDLGALVEQYGSSEDAFSAVDRAAQQLAGQPGVVTTWLNVGGVPVWVRGTTVNGSFRIGTLSGDTANPKYPFTGK
jgi:filamentous hemagglutinin